MRAVFICMCASAIVRLGTCAPPPSPPSCALEQVHDHVWGTSHFLTPDVGSLDACCAQCAAHDKCKAYTWEDDRGASQGNLGATPRCYLKDNDAEGGHEAGRISGRKSPGPAQCTVQTGIEYLGNDIAPAVPSNNESACCAACSADPACEFFTYEGGAGGLCHHKNTNAPDYSRHNASCTSGFNGVEPPTPPVPTLVDVAVGPAIGAGGPNHVCYNIDASRNRGFFWRNISATPGSYGSKLAKQAAALGQAQQAGFALLRFGGSGNDYLTYEFGDTPCPTRTATKECMNETVWRGLLSFTEAASAKMIFGLSMNTGQDAADFSSPHAPWDPTNAHAILKWTIAQGLDHLIFGFELGNEQNGKYTGDQIATNFAVLYKLTVELWPDASRRPVLFGPDPHSLHAASGSQLDWIAAWLDGCKKRGVPVYGVTHHEYIEVDPTAAGFTSSSKYALNGAIAAAVNRTVREHSATARVFGGEIGPHNGGSPPCNHGSMRWATFGDSLWYADALAAKAKNGYSGLCRQDYIGADYGMLDCSTGAPLPDYFTALLWARTMGPAPLHVRATTAQGAVVPPETSAVRVYAHCTRGVSGGVTVLAINLANGTNTTLEFGAASGGTVSDYVLSPAMTGPTASLTKQTGLLGTGTLLNGVLLSAAPDGTAPVTAAVVRAGTSAVLPPLSIGFFMLPNADHPGC